MTRNITLYPWYRFLRNLTFWQATWFLYFQSELSAPQAILLYVVYDLTVTLLEVPSGYLSDRIGRRPTLILSALAGVLGALALTLGNSFALLALGQAFLGAHAAFASGTDSSLYFESLHATGRDAEVEDGEVVAWRFSFAALALSAITGGLMALVHPALPFAASAAAFVLLLALTFLFREPPHEHRITSEVERLATLWTAFRTPILAWLFAIGTLMYGYSHIPFVFGQPFIAEALERTGYSAEAPLVSGTVTAAMMLLSVVVSLAAPKLRQRVGLAPMLLFAFGLQIFIAALLASTNAVWLIAILLLRMVPDALSTPFITARLQPLLSDDSRATFLSLKSLAGRLAFAASLTIAATSTTQAAQMPYADIQKILWAYTVVGLIALLLLALTARIVSRAPKGQP